jgi:DNA transposition AAA+ family ATPase
MSNTTTELPVSRSEQAAAASANARLSIPLNLDNWKALPPETQQQMAWFHQHCLDQNLSLKDAGKAINYDSSTVWRVLKGTYEGNWPNICKSIESYKRVVEERGKIQRQEFVHNRITKLIWAGLDYALANQSMTLIEGESRMGKTLTAQQWRDENNHGRSVLITAPVYGGTKALINEIAKACGLCRNMSATAILDGIYRAFNPYRILLVDEAHRLLPGESRGRCINLELVRDIHDRTGCALGLLATHRLNDEMRKGTYQYEQILGRIGMPVRLPKTFKEEDYMAIVRQYVKHPSQKLTDLCKQIAHDQGRLGILVQTLRVGSRIANKEGSKTVKEEHIFKAFGFRKAMSEREK